MTFDIPKIVRSKQAFRQRLAAQPVAEKLRLLDELRRRAVAIAAGRPPLSAPAPSLPESPVPERNRE